MKLTKSQLKEMIREELKLTEDFKNSEWEVYVADEKGREKVVKVAKSKRAAVILYNKLIKTDKYFEVGMRVVKEGKLTEAIKKVDDAEDGAGFRQDWIGIYKGKFIQFKANFPVDAKKHTINYFKVPKSKYNEVVVISKSNYDDQLKLKVEGKLTEKSAISLNLWIKEFERLAKKNRMKPVDFVKKHISKRKGMDNEVVKNVLKHFQKNEGKLSENKIYSKKDGLKLVKKLQAKDKKIYKVDKQKATYDGKKVLMYNLYTKDKSKYSGNNLSLIHI